MSNTQVVYRKKIIETLEELPESKLKEILDFIEFLRRKRKKKEDPILYPSRIYFLKFCWNKNIWK